MRQVHADAGCRPVAFLDRDGTINVKAPEGEYITGPEELELLPGAAAAIRALNDAGVPVAVVTNQRGIALGRMTEADLAAVHARLAQMLAEQAGARLDLIEHCPHDRGECDCRKPLPGMLARAAERLGPIDRQASVMIGDSESDVQAGRAYGVPAILLHHDVPDLRTAVAGFLSRPSPHNHGSDA